MFGSIMLSSLWLLSIFTRGVTLQDFCAPRAEEGYLLGGRWIGARAATCPQNPDLLDPTEIFFPPAQLQKKPSSCILECHSSTTPILSALHLQGPTSNIYLHLSKQAIDWNFILNVNPSIKHAIKLENQKYYQTLISSDEVIIFVTYHWKDLCHSKMELKLVIWF